MHLQSVIVSIIGTGVVSLDTMRGHRLAGKAPGWMKMVTVPTERAKGTLPRDVGIAPPESRLGQVQAYHKSCHKAQFNSPSLRATTLVPQLTSATATK